jgi:hypothetical protein
MGLDNRVELASTDSLVLSYRNELNFAAFLDDGTPVLVAPVLGPLENLKRKVDHFLGFAGCFGDTLDQFGLGDIVPIAFNEQGSIQGSSCKRRSKSVAGSRM